MKKLIFAFITLFSTAMFSCGHAEQTTEQTTEQMDSVEIIDTTGIKIFGIDTVGNL